MIKIGNIVLANNLAAAPLAGITNVVYRELMNKYGAGLVVSEMISDNALFYHNRETDKIIITSPKERPVALQIFGGSKETLLAGLKVLEEKADFDILDINLGCPVPKVIKQKAGSAWLRLGREQELEEMLTAVVNASSHPVTIKVRTGWDSNSINIVTTCQIAEKAGVSAIAIHGRTRSQFYEGIPNYQLIAEAKKMVKIPIFANGNINSVEDYVRVKMETLADGFMIGRGALGNPLLFQDILDYEEGKEIVPHTLARQKELFLEHFFALVKLKGEYIALQEFRTIMPHYFKGFAGIKQLKVAIIKAQTKEEVIKLLHETLTEETKNESNN